MSILEVANLKKSFDDTEVIRDISFSMEEGEAVTIIVPVLQSVPAVYGSGERDSCTAAAHGRGRRQRDDGR